MPIFQLRNHIRQIAVRSRSTHQRDMRRAFENLFALLLGYATEYAKLLALRLQLFEIGQPMEDFLLGFVTNRARVIEDQVCLIDRFHLSITLMNQRADDFFRVVHVHLAPESFEVKGLVGLRGHTVEYNASREPLG
jgi:hypothetical protein